MGHLFPIVLLVLLSSCHRSNPSTTGSSLPLDEQASISEPPAPSRAAPAGPAHIDEAHAQAINQLGFDLYGQLRGQGGNLALSPASVSLAFGMTYPGARGETAEEMARVLHFAQLGDDLHGSATGLLSWTRQTEGTDADLRITNRLFGERTYQFRPEYLELVERRYSAPLEPVDLRGNPAAVRAHINGWVDTETEHRIEEILPEGALDSLTRLVLVNAVTFTGQWASRFDPAETRDQAFHRLDGSSPAVPMMHQTVELGLGHVEGAQVLELPYVGEQLVMTVFLPEAQDGLGDLERRLDEELFRQGRESLERQEVEVALPRFSIAGAPFSLKRAFQALGMVLAFDDSRADLSGMAAPDSRRLYVKDVFHNTFVEVDERGTEAAASTAVVVNEECARLTSTFTADHPFLFTINHRETGALFFLGRVHSPQG